MLRKRVSIQGSIFIVLHYKIIYLLIPVNFKQIDVVKLSTYYNTALSSYRTFVLVYLKNVHEDNFNHIMGGRMEILLS